MEYKVIARTGAFKTNFSSHYDTYEGAYEVADYYNFCWIDENGFEWQLEVE